LKTLTGPAIEPLRPCLIKSTTVLWMDGADGTTSSYDGRDTFRLFPRALNVWEMLISMGFPVDHRLVAPYVKRSASYAPKVTSFNNPNPSGKRTRSQMAQQAGNSMHINSIGIALIYMLLSENPRVAEEEVQNGPAQ
jgi:hypothetical protein